MTGSRRFSIVVPTYQRRDVLVGSLRSYAALEAPWPVELVVVVDGSTDGSAEAARAVALPFPVRVVVQENRGAAAARNRGAAEARGEILLFLDDDMVVDPRLLVEHDAVLREGADAVIGHIPLHPDSPRTLLTAGVDRWAKERHLRLARNRGQLALHDLLTGQLSVRHEVFRRAHGFDETFNARGEFGAEDTDFLHRLLQSGAAVRYAPGAVSYQRYVVTPSQNLRQWRQGGRADAVLVRKHPVLLSDIVTAHGGHTPSGWVLSRWAHAVPSQLGRALAAPVVARAAAGKTDGLTAWAFTRVRDAYYWRGVHEGGGFGEDGRAAVVLAYHAVAKVDDPVIGGWCVTPEQFEDHIDALLGAGFTFVGIGAVLDQLGGGAALPVRSVLLTFDDAYVSLLDGALPVTAAREIPALAFVVGEEIGGWNRWDSDRGAVELPLLSVDQLRVLVGHGWALGSHSGTHAHLTQQDAAGLRRELDRSLRDIRATGLPVEPVLAYPFGEHDVRVRAAARRAGYVAAFALEGRRPPTGSRGRFAWPRIEVRSGTTAADLVSAALGPPSWPLRELERDARGMARRVLGALRGVARRSRRKANTATARPGPTRVLFIDLDQPLPEFTVDDRYQSAMVVGTRDRIPRGAVTVDFGPAAPPVSDQLAPLFTAAPDATRAPAVPDVELPSITVVVPTIVERPEDLQLLLDGFADVDYPDVEFLLVDNRRARPDDDPLPGLVAGRSRIRVIREVRPGISAARNAGIAAAAGEVIAFTDDDVLVEPEWLRAIGSRFATDPVLDAVTGLILPAEMETTAQIWFERYYGGFSGERTFAPLTLRAAPGPKWLRGSRVTVRDASNTPVREFAVYGVGAYGAGANMAFRRSTLLQLGVFDVALGTGTPARGGEDLAMLIQILWTGGVIGYEPAAVAHHRHRREVGELMHQLRGNGVGFTAMLTSLILADQRHLLGLGSQLPLAGWRIFRQSLARIRGKEVGGAGPAQGTTGVLYPRELVLNELSGYPRGPRAYLHSRKQMKAWVPPAAVGPPAEP